MKKIIILGSTGSIGTQAVEIALNNKDKYKVVALSANKKADLALEQAKKLDCKNILISDSEVAKTIQDNVPTGVNLLEGIARIKDLLELEADIMLNALVGSIGLEATILALEKDVRLALANKESLVVGGDIINAHYKDKKKNIIPVDSEHSALFQLILGENVKEINKLILTASGGPFRQSSADEMKNATVEDALAHPRWNMGPKITIDSATLVNKGLEAIEAHYLFDMPYERIDVIIHPQSIIHSMIEFIDGSVKAHLGPTDMRIPIQYALSYPQRFSAPAGLTDFVRQKELTFEEVNFEKFKALKLAYEAGKQGRGYPIAYNAANEVAVASFLDKKITLAKITDVIEEVIEQHEGADFSELEKVKELDKMMREKAKETINKI